MAEDRLREMRGDGSDIEERTSDMLDSDVRKKTRQPVNISSKNGAMSVSIVRIDAHAKADACVQLAVPFGRASGAAMPCILV
jgi:hypothetical protein